MEYHEAMRKLMGKSLLTKTDLAQRLGVSRQALYAYLENDIKVSTLIRLCEAMGCHVYIGDEDIMYEVR